MKSLVVAVHGILTRQTVASWPDRLDAYLGETKVIKKEYIAAPLPVWNVFMKNHLLARGLAEEVSLFHKAGFRIHFVAHSNGCDIVLKAVKRLAKMNIATYAMLLIGSVTEPDVEKSGVAELLRQGWLQKAVAYASTRDRALRIHLKWPYRNLGVSGWVLPRGHRSIPFPTSCVTRHFDDFGHGEYFSAENRNSIFAAIKKDLEVAP